MEDIPVSLEIDVKLYTSLVDSALRALKAEPIQDLVALELERKKVMSIFEVYSKKCMDCLKIFLALNKDEEFHRWTDELTNRRRTVTREFQLRRVELERLETQRIALEVGGPSQIEIGSSPPYENFHPREAPNPEPAASATPQEWARPPVFMTPQIHDLPEFSFNESQTSADRLSFKRFLLQFETAAAGMATGRQKLMYLRRSLKGRAYDLVSELSLTDENYRPAIDNLKRAYWDANEIRRTIFEKLLTGVPKPDRDFGNLNHFITKVNSELIELRQTLECDFLEEQCSGGQFLAYVLFNRFPEDVRGEMIQYYGYRDPPLDIILNGTSVAIKNLLAKRGGWRPPPPAIQRVNRERTRGGDRTPKSSFSPQSQGTMSSFYTQATRPKRCVLCSRAGHDGHACWTYDSQEARLQRCRLLRVCTVCFDSTHFAESCPSKGSMHGGHPSSSVNVAGVNDGSSRTLDPMIKVVFHHGSRSVEVNCLYDTGSQRSYLDSSVLAELGVGPSPSNVSNLRICTFLGSADYTFQEHVLEVEVVPGEVRPCPILCAEGLDFSYKGSELPQVAANLEALQLTMAAMYERGSHTLTVKGILGSDLIQYLPLKTVTCMNGMGYEVPTGIIPFGRVEHFLHLDREQPSCTVETPLNFQTVLADTQQVPAREVSYVMKTTTSYVDPLKDVFVDSEVQRGLDMLFSIESLGLPAEEDHSEYDQKMVQQFQDSILFKEGHYHVHLPWYKEKLARVKSNHSVALRVLEGVTRTLHRKGMYQSYLEVFKAQEREGIIEEIQVTPDQFGKYVWIPHHPVFKGDEQSTTKLRPVFNCSYKGRDGTSLNEAAYPGVNLMSNMLELLLQFRTNKYVLLADIRKAFLMIKLASKADRNRFCFFLRDGEHLRCFRYTTILFGFTASPFILSCILRYHASKYPRDECTSMLQSGFYVDNLVKTGGSTERLARLYTGAKQRLMEGGFELQACVTNSSALRDKIVQDGTQTEHSSEWEKVLGYHFNPLNDHLSVSGYRCDSSANTKRQILSEASKVFDPLSLYLPITIRGRILVGELWKLGMGWDKEVPPESLKQWTLLAADLSMLSQIHFRRRALDGNGPATLCVFCDASEKAYGFVAYMIQGGHSNFVFAKSKVAPQKSKSLPTLELLAVYLAFKCLPTLLQAYGSVDVETIQVAVDAQVVLSWLVSESITTKKAFVRNRLVDIRTMLGEVESQFNTTLTFRYVPTAENPADLITRGLTVGKFKELKEFWVHGPKWLCEEEIPWPTQNLNCLSESSKRVVSSSVNVGLITPESPTVIPFEKFSTLAKLVAVMKRVYQFIDCLRGRSEDWQKRAHLGLIKTMQKQAFPVELEFVSNPAGKKMPDLVASLCLFLDEEGVLRSKGRIERTHYFGYGVSHPVLLGKEHPLTHLIILDAHHSNEHLGATTTLTGVRLKGYWIPQGRQAVKSAIASCARCKRYNATPFSSVGPTSLPAVRVNLHRPFQYTGVDYTGHLSVRDGESTVKMYILLFTCLSVRAVHLELVPDMTVLAFFQAFVRFTNRFGVPSHLYSDNAKTFLGGGRLFQQLWLLDEYKAHFEAYNIKHNTIPLYSAWFGGTWERLIRVVKNCLYKAFGRSTVSYFTLFTRLSDVQRAVNNRPLTYQGSLDDGWEVITPGHFFGPKFSPGLLANLGGEELETAVPPNREGLVRMLRDRDEDLGRFHELWYDQYLLSLREIPSGSPGSQRVRDIKLGDIVVVRSPLRTRPFWLLGRITALHKGNDGLVRSAEVLRGDGSSGTHSLALLYPTELGTLPRDDNPPLNLVPQSVISPFHSQSYPSQEEDDSQFNPDPPSSNSDESREICPSCGQPWGDAALVGCDRCNHWFHFPCVGMVEAPPIRQKWYCLTCAPLQHRRGRPSLLPRC